MEAFGKFRRQIFTAFAGNLGALSFGAAWSWTATSLPSMAADSDGGWPTGLSKTDESLISSLPYLGCLVSTVLSGYCIERYGRRMSLLLANVPCLVAWVMIGLAPSLPFVFVGRFLSGIATGCYSGAAPLYVAETSHASVRGRLICTFDLMVAAGMLLMNVIGSLTPWRMQAFACATIPLVGQLCLLVAPESPRFLMEKGRTHAAKLALTWLNPCPTAVAADGEAAIEKELVQIAHTCQQDKEMTDAVAWWRLIRRRSVLKPILIGCMLMVCDQFSGNYPIQAYGVALLDQALGKGSEQAHAYNALIIINGAQFVSSFIPVFFVDHIGRRPLLFISEVGMGLMLGLVGLYFTLKELQGSSWIPFSVLIVYEICFSIGIGPIPFLIMGELVSPQFAGASLGIITFVYHALGFGSMYIFHDLMRGLGEAGVYYFFAGCCLLAALACFALVPDTTGKSLIEIHNEAGTGKEKDSRDVKI